MANTVERSVLVDSPQYAVIHLYLFGADGDGDEADTVVVDASALTDGNSVSNIHKVQGCLVGFSARLEIDGSTDAEAVVLPPDTDFCYDFTKHNFPVNKLANLADSTGDITITTTNMGDGDEGFLIITVKKDS